MKLIIAIFHSHKLNDVKQELFKAKINKMTVSNILGCGEQKHFTELYRGVVSEVDLLKGVQLEIAVNEDFVEPCISAIIKGAKSGDNGEGEIGDGKIFVIELAECIRIRNGDRGKLAVG